MSGPLALLVIDSSAFWSATSTRGVGFVGQSGTAPAGAAAPNVADNPATVAHPTRTQPLLCTSQYGINQISHCQLSYTHPETALIDPLDRCVISRIVARRAESESDRVALVFENRPHPDEVVTFGDLAARGNRLAHRLKS